MKKNLLLCLTIMLGSVSIATEVPKAEQNVTMEKSYINKIKIHKNSDVNFQNIELKSSFLNWITVTSGKCSLNTTKKDDKE